jgi:TIR domain
MPGIFISYRRVDAAGEASHLYDDLSRHFGDDMVFRDIYSLDPGVEYDEAIQHWVGDCDVLLVLIGRQWLSLTGSDGHRRLDDPHDLHRREVEAALSRRVRVIPVLTQDTAMPSAEELPGTLARLATRHAFRLSDDRWSADVAFLADRLSGVLTTPAPNGRAAPSSVRATVGTAAPARTVPAPPISAATIGERPAPHAGVPRPQEASVQPFVDRANSSGEGKYSVVPDEIRGWSWGAFLMSWIWGLGNGTPIALLVLVPYAGLVMPFVLGVKGNEWAWRNKRWDDVQHFQRVQRQWKQWGVGLWIVGLLLLFLIVVGSQ